MVERVLLAAVRPDICTAHAATVILAVGAIYILLDACEPLPLFHRTIRKTLYDFRRGAGVCVAWCRFNAFMTAIRFAGGRLYAWICVIEFKSLVRDNFDRESAPTRRCLDPSA
jgi:hypothetical protein